MLTDLSDYVFVEAGFVNDDGEWRRNIILNINNIEKFRNAHGNKGVYTTQYRSKTKDLRGSEVYSDLYFDFDCETNPEIARQDALMCLSYLKVNFEIPYDVPNIYFSGKKGFHIIVDGSYLGIEPHKSLNFIYKLLATDIKLSLSKEKTLDTKIYDKVRMFRLAGSVHQGTGLYKIPITYNELKTLNRESIMQLAVQPRVLPPKGNLGINSRAAKEIKSYYERYEKESTPRAKKNMEPLKLDKVPPCIDWVIANGVTKGNRNLAIMVLSSFFYQTGLTKDQVAATVIHWNDSLTEPTPLPEVERCIQYQFEHSYKYGCNAIKEFAQCDPSNCKLSRRK